MYKLMLSVVCFSLRRRLFFCKSISVANSTAEAELFFYTRFRVNAAKRTFIKSRTGFVILFSNFRVAGSTEVSSAPTMEYSRTAALITFVRNEFFAVKRTSFCARLCCVFSAEFGNFFDFFFGLSTFSKSIIDWFTTV